MAIYFDLEYYVPPKDRISDHKLKFDPAQDAHLIIGGVFYQAELPSRFQADKAQKLWIWDMKNFTDDPYVAERKLLEIINKIFQGELDRRNVVKSVGIGIGRSDLPALFVKSSKYDIANTSQLYRRFFSGYPIDLSVAGIGYVNSHPHGFEPVSTNNLFSSWNINFQKSSGTRVWGQYDEQEYHLIENRTLNEVENIVNLYSILNKELSS